MTEATTATPAAPAVVKNKRTFIGRVVSDKRAKTVTVLVERRTAHELYGKIVGHSRKYHAHDEKGEARVGDRVELMACRPMSKLKRWRLVRVVERGVVTTEVGVDTALEGALGVKKKDGVA